MPDSLSAWRVLVTTGGTREPIDPVRYIGNRSSGKMGLAVATVAADRGAQVTLISTVAAPDFSGHVVRVETAQEMAEAVWSRAAEQDVIVMVAAVADFRPADPIGEKIRRDEGLSSIDLEPTPDILAGISDTGTDSLVVGFAAEVGSLERAGEKVVAKGVDLLVANDVLAEGSGFGTDTNQVTIFFKDGSSEPWPLLTKDEVAVRLWDTVVTLREQAAHPRR